MSCCTSDRALGRATRIFLWLVLLAFGGVVLASLPELRRYLKISNM